MQTKRWLAGGTGVAVLAAGLLLLRQPPGKDTKGAAAPLPTPQHAPAPPPAPVPQAVPASLAPPAAEAPLSVQIDRLLASRRPEDAYQAYILVSDCAAYNANGDRIVFDREELRTPGALPGFRGMTEDEKRHDARLCAGMSERQRLSRLDSLAVAARAGVHGAAVNFAIEGPFGDPSALQTRPDDPLVREWKATAAAQLIRAAESGADMGALEYLGTEYATGTALTDKQPLLAYRYLSAAKLIEEDLLGRDPALARTLAAQRAQLSTMVADYSPEQRAAELAAAQRIAATAKAWREQARRGATAGR